MAVQQKDEELTNIALKYFIGRPKNVSKNGQVIIDNYYNARRKLLKQHNHCLSQTSPKVPVVVPSPSLDPLLIDPTIPLLVSTIVPNKASDIDIAKKLIQLHTSANSRNLDFNLDIKTVRKLLNTKKCYFTGEILTSGDPNDRLLRTVDRIDNNKGYIIGNVVACSKWFNGAKDSLTPDNIILLYNGMKKANLIK